MTKIPRFLTFRFEIIGKLETNTEDTRCMLELLNVTHLFNAELHNMKSGNGKSDNKVIAQFKTLTSSQIHGLYEVYKYDFEAFEYEYKSFFDLAAESLQQLPPRVYSNDSTDAFKRFNPVAK